MGWCRESKHDVGNYTLVKLVRMTEIGLRTSAPTTTSSGMGYIPRRCIEMGKEQATAGLTVQGGTPAVQNLVKAPSSAPDKFSKFLKALYSNFKSSQDALIQLGFRASDIDELSSTDEAYKLIEQGISPVLFGIDPSILIMTRYGECRYT